MSNRIIMTEDEKVALNKIGENSDGTMFNLAEGNIDELIKTEKARKFNDDLNKFASKIEHNKDELVQKAEELGDIIEKAEILPMFSRVIVKRFEHNPFQKITVNNGIITDVGGYAPIVEKDPMSGEWREREEFIVTGVVLEVGPEVKYLQEGDVVYYRKDTAAPVPFLKQKLVSLAENQIIAVVNEGLSDRFNRIKNG